MHVYKENAAREGSSDPQLGYASSGSLRERPATHSDVIQGLEPIQSNDSDTQDMLAISGIKILCLVLYSFTDKPVGGHVAASDGEAGVDLPSLRGITLDTTWSGQRDMNWDLSVNQPAEPSIEDADRAFRFLGDDELLGLGLIEGNASYSDLRNLDVMDRMPIETPASPSRASERLSIDQKPSHSTQLIGFSNESDPVSLQHFPYNNLDEVDFFRVTYRKFSAPRSPSRNGDISGYPPPSTSYKARLGRQSRPAESSTNVSPRAMIGKVLRNSQMELRVLLS